MKYDMEHPDYPYKIEKGGFSAWLAEDCIKKVNKKKEKRNCYIFIKFLLHSIFPLSTIYLHLTFSSSINFTSHFIFFY